MSTMNPSFRSDRSLWFPAANDVAAKSRKRRGKRRFLLNRSFPRPVTALPDGPVLCALRPEKIALAPPEEGNLLGVVRKSTFIGPVIRFIIDVGAERPLVVEESAASARTASPGERVSLRFSPEDLRLFGNTSPEAAPMKKEATP